MRVLDEKRARNTMRAGLHKHTPRIKIGSGRQRLGHAGIDILERDPFTVDREFKLLDHLRGDRSTEELPCWDNVQQASEFVFTVRRKVINDGYPATRSKGCAFLVIEL